MTRLMLTFVTDAGKRISLSIPEPKTPLTEEEVLDTMDEIISGGLFKPGGSNLVAPFSAKIVESNTTVVHKA